MNAKPLACLTAFIGLFLLTSVHAVSYVYKWTGEDGSVKYTERPPAKGTPYKKILIQGKDDSAAVPVKKPDYDLPKKADEKTDQAANGNDNYNKWRDENCKMAKQNLDILTNGGRIGIDDGEGGKRLMTDDEISEAKKKAEEQIDKFCGEPDI